MNNHVAAEAISKMGEQQRKQVRAGLYGLICKSLAVLSLIGAIGVFLSLQSIEEERLRYLNEGVVSNALVLGATAEGHSTDGDDAEPVPIVHDPNSQLSYYDFAANGSRANLPVPMAGDSTGALQPDDAAVAATVPGKLLVVVSTPYAPSSPRTYQSLRDFSATRYYVWLSIFGALSAGLWLVGQRFSKK